MLHFITRKIIVLSFIGVVGRLFSLHLPASDYVLCSLLLLRYTVCSK